MSEGLQAQESSEIVFEEPEDAEAPARYEGDNIEEAFDATVGQPTAGLDAMVKIFGIAEQVMRTFNDLPLDEKLLTSTLAEFSALGDVSDQKRMDAQAEKLPKHLQVQFYDRAFEILRRRRYIPNILKI